MPHLFVPFTLKGVTLRNRIVAAPMCMYSASEGVLGAWHRAHLEQLAEGGALRIVQDECGQAQAGTHGRADRHVSPAGEIGRPEADAGGGIHDPGQADADAEHVVDLHTGLAHHFAAGVDDLAEGDVGGLVLE